MSSHSTGSERRTVEVAERRAFSVETFAHRNGISRRQAFKEIAAGRLVARKVGSRTIVTVDAERKWQRALPKVIPKATEAKIDCQGPARRSRALPTDNATRVAAAKATRKRSRPLETTATP